MPIASVSNRFIILSLPIIAYLWLLVFKGRKYNTILYLYPAVYIFTLSVVFRQYLKVTDWDFYIMNPFYLIYKHLFL